MYSGVAPMGTCDSNTTNPTCGSDVKPSATLSFHPLIVCVTKLLRHDAADVWMEQSQQSACGCLTNLQQLI